MPSQSTIAVTGVSGHIGNVVCTLLLQKGYRVKALFHRYKESIGSLPIETLQGDVLNKSDLRRLIAVVKWSLIVQPSLASTAILQH